MEKLVKLNIKQKAKITSIEVPANINTMGLKDKIKEVMQLDPLEQVLIHKGHILKDEETLESLNIQSEETIELIIVAKKPQVKAQKEETKFTPVHLESGGHGIFNKLGFAAPPSSAAAGTNTGLNENMYKSMMEMVFIS